MENAARRNPGTYVLLVYLSDAQVMTVGSLGTLKLPDGFYLYFGSALGGLEARLARHLRHTKRIRWHVDYLLKSATVEEVWYAVSSQRLECSWAQAGRGLPGYLTKVARFGSSDCDCSSHLLHFLCKPKLSDFLLHLPEGYPPVASLSGNQLSQQGIEVMRSVPSSPQG